MHIAKDEGPHVRRKIPSICTLSVAECWAVPGFDDLLFAMKEREGVLYVCTRDKLWTFFFCVQADTEKVLHRVVKIYHS